VAHRPPTCTGSSCVDRAERSARSTVEPVSRPWCLVQAIGDSDRPRKASARGVRARPLPPPRLLASQPALRAAYGEATGRSSNAFASAAATLQRRHGSAGSLYARTPAGAPAQPRPESSQRAKQHAAGARSQLSSTRQQGPAEQPDRQA